MHIALNVLAVSIGFLLLFIYFRSIVRVILLNRRERDFIGRSCGRLAVSMVHAVVGDTNDQDRVQRLKAWVMPIYIFLAVVAWFLLVQLAFTFILIGTGVDNEWAHAFMVSGSALSTLGFATPPDLLGQYLAVFEAGIGLAVVILLFTFVPGYQASVQIRERRVGWLYSRTGQHPNAIRLLEAQKVAGRLDDSDWEEWESWFRGLLETHAISPILCYVPSIYRGTNWVGAAAAVLDTTSLLLAALDRQHTSSARLCRETGVMAVRTIAAELYGSEPVPTPASQLAEPLPDFTTMYERLKELGLPVQSSESECNEAFIRLRAEYEPSLRYISEATLMPVLPPTASPPRQGPSTHPLAS